MTPDHDDHSPLFFPDGYYWDPTLVDPYAPLLEWFTLEGCDELHFNEDGSVFHSRLRGIEYHVGDRTDVDGNGAEVIVPLVMGSPFDASVLEEMVSRLLPDPMPSRLEIEVDFSDANDNLCWLVCRFTPHELDTHQVIDRLMSEFVAMTEDFLARWSAA